MNKRILLWIIITIIAIIIVLGLLRHFFLHDDSLSDFQNALADNAHVKFADMSSMRSEVFPVATREDGALWRIALIENDEVFFTSFDSPKQAQICYMTSMAKCSNDSLFLCGRDVIYYRGNNQDTIQSLHQIALSFEES